MGAFPKFTPHWLALGLALGVSISPVQARTPPVPGSPDFFAHCQSLLSRLGLVGKIATDSAPTTTLETLRNSGASPAYLEAFRVVEEGFADFPERVVWLSQPKREPRTQAWVDRLLELGESERADFRNYLRKKPIANAKLQKIAMLALYDHAVWHAYFDSFTRYPQLDEALINSLVPVLRKMPDDLLQSLYDRIPPIYANLTKMNFRPVGLTIRTDLRLAPKRAVDAFIRNTMRADEKIRAAVMAGASPLDAYAAHIEELQTRIFAKAGVSKYRADDVVSASRAVQSVLKKNGRRFPKGEVLMTGSFPNGRAKLASSDVDCVLSDPEMKPLLGEFDVAVNASLRGAYPEAKLEFHTMWQTTTPNFAADISPFQIRVNEDRVELLVYGPDQVLHQDKVRLAINYPEAESYVIHTENKDLPAGPIRAGWPYSRGPPLPLNAPVIESKLALENALASIGEGPSAVRKSGRWMEEPQSEPGVQKLVENILNLGETDRARVLAKIAQSPPRDSNLKRILTLALYDEAAWLAYYAEITTKPQADRALIDALTPVFSGMPTALREKLAALVRRDYANLKKEKWVRTWTGRKTYLELGPKRAIDVLIRQIYPPAPFFAKRIAEGAEPLKVYAEYLTSLREKFFTSEEFGGYQAGDLLDVATEIQLALRRNPTKITEENPSLIIAGSVPTGRARIRGSDIDLIPSHYSLEKLYPEMEKKINSLLDGRYPGANFELHSMFSTTTSVDAAVVSPVMLRVDADHVDLLVYPAFRPHARDQHFLPENYPPPIVYRLR